jgi:hypothetical protein
LSTASSFNKTDTAVWPIIIPDGRKDITKLVTSIKVHLKILHFVASLRDIAAPQKQLAAIFLG